MKDGILSKFFGGKKENQFIEKITTLENELEVKSQEIIQLKEELKTFTEKTTEKINKSDIFEKQLDIIEKNLKDKALKNDELQQQLKNQLNEKQLLTDKLNNLNNELEGVKKEKVILDSKFQSIDTELVKVSNENKSLKEINEELEEQINILYSNKETQSMGEATLPSTEVPINQDINFKLPIDILFDANKFEAITTLILKDFTFIDEIDLEIIKKKYGYMDHFGELEKIYLDFLDGRYTWKVKTYLLNGPSLTKIFQRQRKLLNLFRGLYFEFLIDLDNFNEELFVVHNFSQKQIDAYKVALKEYNSYRLS